MIIEEPDLSVLDAATVFDIDDPRWAKIGKLVDCISCYTETPARKIVDHAVAYNMVLTNKVPLTAKHIAALPDLKYIGVLATGGTVASRSYNLEIEKLHPGFSVATLACPMFVPLVENSETESPAADYFAAKYISSLLEKDRRIDTIILACTHYPLLYDVIRRNTPPEINVVCQGGIVADSLADYMERHPEIAGRCTTGGKCTYLTTENPEAFADLARVFLDEDIEAKHVELN